MPQQNPVSFDNCRVLGGGPTEDGTVNILLELTDNNHTKDWYVANPNVRHEILETALTALSANLPVSVLLESTTRYSKLDRLYVMKQ